MDSTLVIHVVSDITPLILLSQIGIVMGSFASGVSIVFLIDFFKRKGWIYHHKKKKVTQEIDSDGPFPKRENK
jgi:hypothetical protein